MKRQTATLIATLSVAFGLVAGENINGIYLGTDVSGDKGTIAVQIQEDGTVIAYRGQIVPMMHDRYGHEVHIRKVELR